MKKFLSIFLSLIMVLSMCCVGVTISNASTQGDNIVSVAIQEAKSLGTYDGNYGGYLGSSNKYNNYSGLAWCAYFVRWCAQQCGISTNIIPANYVVPNIKSWYEQRNLYHTSRAYGGTYTPKAGDLVIFDWDYDSSDGDHIGIVTAINGEYLSTVEGNTNGSGYLLYRTQRLKLSHGYIIGYCSPAYEDTYADLGTEFYAYIINSASWLHLSNDSYNVSAKIATYLNEQIWRFTRNSDGSYLIRSALDNNCLDVDNSNTANGTNVKVCAYNKMDAQKWYLIESGGNYIIRSKLGNCVLDLAGGSTISGTNIQICEKSYNAAQYFTIWKVGVPGENLGDAFYAYITNTAYWLYLSNDYDNVSAKSPTYLTEQIWHFERQNDNSYVIKSASSDKCLDVDGANTVSGTNVKVCTYNGTDAQKWYLIKVGDNKYIIRSKLGNCVLDLENGLNESGTNIEIYETNDTDSQFYSIYKYEEPATAKVKVETTGTNVRVSWNIIEGAARYDVYLIQSPYSWEDVKYSKQISFDMNYCDFKGVEPGNYTAFVVTKPNENSKQSNWVDFTVGYDSLQPANQIIYNGHIYSLYNDVYTWEEAKSKCEEMGGHLVTVTSSEEQKVIEKLIENQFCRWYFLGATNVSDGVHYQWVTGETFSYTNWHEGSPDNNGDSEHYLMATTRINGQWQDTNIDGWGNVIGFICEVETAKIKSQITDSLNGNTYELYDHSLTWEDANKFAESKGGHLVTINSEEENQFVYSLLQNGTKDYYFYGAKYNNSKFNWVTGEEFNLSYWAENEPNNEKAIENYLMTYKNSNEWNDSRNQLSCSGFIVEYEKEILPGDVNNDGVISISDATAIQKYLVKLADIDNSQMLVADVNGDGIVTIRDVTYIQMYLAKFINEFPVTV